MRGLPFIYTLCAICEGRDRMNSNTAPLPRTREQLAAQLAQIRRESLSASARGDFRSVARLTLEAARLNKEIAEILPPESTTR